MSRREIDRRIWGLAWPAILRFAFMSTAGLITLALVGTLGPEAIAAVGLAQRIIFMIIGGITALTVGPTTLVAYHVGANDKRTAQSVVAQSLLVGTVVSIILGVLGVPLPEHFIAWLMLGSPDPEVIALGGHYLRIIILSMTLGIPMMIINAAQQGGGDARTPMFMAIGINAGTLILGYVLIVGPGSFPSLGILGAAFGEGIARACGGLVAIGWCWVGGLRSSK